MATTQRQAGRGIVVTRLRVVRLQVDGVRAARSILHVLAAVASGSEHLLAKARLRGAVALSVPARSTGYRRLTRGVVAHKSSLPSKLWHRVHV